MRSDKLDANTWSRNASANPLLAQPAPLSMHQFGGTIGGPLVLGQFNKQRDKLFFFWAEEGVRLRTEATNTGTVPSALMRKGDFSELLDPNNVWFGRVVTIRDPLTGQPFANNVIPACQLSPNGLALLNTFPLPTDGFRRGNTNWIGVSPNPRETRKDTVRFDYVLGSGNQIAARVSHFSWKAVDAFRGQFDLARTQWNRPNTTSAFSWTNALKSNLLNEFTFGYSLDEVFINVFTDPGTHLRSRYGINYPYIFPGKEIEDKIPTISITNFNEVDGGPYPSSSRGPIYTWSDSVSWLKGRHSIKTGVVFEYSGEDDFDQINVNAQPGDTNNQNVRFEFTDSRAGGSGVAVALLGAVWWPRQQGRVVPDGAVSRGVGLVVCFLAIVVLWGGATAALGRWLPESLPLPSGTSPLLTIVLFAAAAGHALSALGSVDTLDHVALHLFPS